MMTQLKTVIRRSHATLVQDMIGASALCVILIVALHLPAFS